MTTVTKGLIQRSDIAWFDGINTTTSRTSSTGGTTTGLRLGNTVDALQVYGGGTARTAATLIRAIDMIGSTAAVIELAPGVWTIDANVTFPSNLRVEGSGATLSITAGKTIVFGGNDEVDYGLWGVTTRDIASLRSLPPSSYTSIAVANIAYHTTAGDGGDGQFRPVSGAAPGTYVDDNGAIIVPTGGDGSSAWLRLVIGGVVHVKWFGAVGDGATNDRSSIQAAIDYAYAAGGGVVQLGRGTYSVSLTAYTSEIGLADGLACILLRDKVRLVGLGPGASIIKLAASQVGVGTYWRIITSPDGDRLDYSEIRDFEIDGNKASQTDTTNINGGNIQIEASGKVLVNNIYSHDACGNGIMVRGVSRDEQVTIAVDIGISQCVASGNNYIGIQISQFGRISVEGNTASGNGGNGIDIYGNDQQSSPSSTPTSYAYTIYGNRADSNGSVSYTGTGIFLETVREGVCMGNVLMGNDIGIAVNAINATPRNAVITGNQLFTNDVGIQITGSTNGVQITGNTFYDSQVRHIQLGASSGSCSNVEIHGNTFIGGTVTNARWLAISGTGGASFIRAANNYGKSIAIYDNTGGGPLTNVTIQPPMYIALAAGMRPSDTWNDGASGGGPWTADWKAWFRDTDENFGEFVSIEATGNNAAPADKAGLLTIKVKCENAYTEGFRVNGNTGVAGSPAIGFYGSTGGQKPEITGSRGGNAALADLLTSLAGLGLITDSSSA